MFLNIFKKIFGTANERTVKSLRPIVDKINSLEESVVSLSDDELKARTPWLKKRLADGETLDDILPDAFATVREAAKRTLGQRHYDVQLTGGILLHRGMITEMRTGEGKTLVATLPVYLNALTEKGVHVITVNDYLAGRDADWMGQIYRFLGLSVGCILNDLSDDERRDEYNCDITYGTNHEFGFDYLRDNMKFYAQDLVQRPFNYCIVDEVDSILIDEARTPLIISGAAEDSSDLYIKINEIMPLLNETHWKKDEKERNVALTEEGNIFVENILNERGLLNNSNMYDLANTSIVHHVEQALKAHTLFRRDVDYLVKDNKVYIIDEFTGRILDGRRYSDGLHQALEAKEHVRIYPENQTLASITYQNYFRLYPKLAGMTGTAMTEATEFSEIYNLNVVEVPTNLPVKRVDHNDEIYRTAREKYDAIVKLIKEVQAKNQPVLVGTVSIEKSELLADLIRKEMKIEPNVLNAKYHEAEAGIIAGAGVPGTITIATNMAGRGTDIQLGGNLEMRLEKELAEITDEELRKKKTAEIKADIEAKKKIAIEAGGLYVVGTERHESRRIDNQLRGRTGRQGDPGESKFFLSLQDDLMRIFGSGRMDAWLDRFGFKEGEAIIHPWITRALEKAQEKVEAMHFDIRKNLLKYDDVMNEQRKIIYSKRREIMNATDLHSNLADMVSNVCEAIAASNIPERTDKFDWNWDGLKEEAARMLHIDLDVEKLKSEVKTEKEVYAHLVEKGLEAINRTAGNFGDDKAAALMIEKAIYLRKIDTHWKEHLLNLEYLRGGIGLRAYGQKDPLNEYKKESFLLFTMMLDNIDREVVETLSDNNINPNNLTLRQVDEDDDEDEEFDPKMFAGVGRNDPCPCGSGKKYKHCHGKL